MRFQQFFSLRLLSVALPAVFAISEISQAFQTAIIPTSSIVPTVYPIYIYEQHQLPIIDIAIDFKQLPQFYEPALAELTTSLLTKGSKEISETQFANELAILGIQLSVNQGEERTQLRVRTLTTNWDKTLVLLSKMLKQPLFHDEVVQREKNRLLANWKEAQKEPETVLETAQNPVIFGNQQNNKSFPLNQLLTENSIKKVSSQLLKEYYHQNYCLPQVVLMGDVSLKQKEQLLQILQEGLSFCSDKTLASLKEKKALETSWDWQNIPLYKNMNDTTNIQNIQNIPHHATQSHIRLMQISVPRTHQDYFPLLVANHILGGNGFNSRLMKEVRENRGLTYGIYSMMQPYREGGLFQIYLRTAKKNTEQALKVTLETWKNFASGKNLTDAELDFAKNQLMASFPLKLDTQKKKLEQLASQHFYNLPDNYLKIWPDLVQKVSKQQVLEVMKKYWLDQSYHVAYLVDPTNFVDKK
jgi:zinc protease